MACISIPLAVVVASANFVDSFYVLLALDPEFHNVSFSNIFYFQTKIYATKILKKLQNTYLAKFIENQIKMDQYVGALEPIQCRF